MFHSIRAYLDTIYMTLPIISEKTSTKVATTASETTSETTSALEEKVSNGKKLYLVTKKLQWSTEGRNIRPKQKFFTIRPSAATAKILF